MNTNPMQVIQDYFDELRRDGYVVDGVDPAEIWRRVCVAEGRIKKRVPSAAEREAAEYLPGD